MQAAIDQSAADIKSTINKMVSDCLADHEEKCGCVQSVCPGPVVVSFFKILGRLELILFASAAIRMFAEEKAKNRAR